MKKSASFVRLERSVMNPEGEAAKAHYMKFGAYKVPAKDESSCVVLRHTVTREREYKAMVARQRKEREPKK